MTWIPHTKHHPIGLIDHGPRPVAVQGVVIHDIEGSAQSAENLFNNPHRAEYDGAHLIVGPRPYGVVQVVDLDHVTWHAPGANSGYVGIEHEGFARFNLKQWMANQRMLKESAGRTAWIMYHYELGLPTWGHNMMTHSDATKRFGPVGGHTDPGKSFPRRRYKWWARAAYRKLVKTNGRRWW